MVTTTDGCLSAGSVPGVLFGLALLLFVQGPANAAGKIDSGFAESGLFRSDSFSRTLVLDTPGGTLVVRSVRDDDCCDGYTDVKQLDEAGRAESLAGLSGGYTTEVAALRPAGGWLLAGSKDPNVPRQRGFIAAFTASGQPDKVFDGEHILPRDTVSKLIVQPDDRILVAENAPRTEGTPCFGAGWTLRRLTATGRNDESWGSGGSITSQSVEGAAGLGCRVHHLWLQPDGRVMLATDSGFLRLLQDGQRDPTFSWSRLEETTIASSQVMPLASGGFVLASTGNGRGGDYTLLSRYDSNGRLDRSFGEGDGFARHGVWQQVISDEAATERVEGGFQVSDDGKYLYTAVVLANRTDPFGPGRGQVIARFSRSGRLDTGFGAGGVVLLSLSSTLDVTDLVPRPDGSLLVVTGIGVLRLTGDDRPSRGLVEAYFASDQVEEGATAFLDVHRLAGSDGPISVTVRTDDAPKQTWDARPGEHFVPVSQRLDWADGDATTRSVKVQIVDDGVAQPNGKILGMLVHDAVGNPLVLWQSTRVNIRDKTSSPPPPVIPPPPVTPPPNGAPGAANGSSGGGGALGNGAMLWLLLLAWEAARRVAPAGGRRT